MTETKKTWLQKAFGLVASDATTFLAIIKKQKEGKSGSLNGFSDNTLINILKWGMSDDELIEKYHNWEEIKGNREMLEEAVIGDIFQEIDAGVSYPKDYPSWNLVSGILYDENWIYLSEGDMEKWCASYGVKTIDGVIFKQNQMLRELLFKNEEFDMVKKLIQAEYDP
jgi:hypothetical protein